MLEEKKYLTNWVLSCVDKDKKIKDLIGFCNKYSKGFEKTNIECSNNSVDNVCVLEFHIKHISGKFQNREK